MKPMEDWAFSHFRSVSGLISADVVLDLPASLSFSFWCSVSEASVCPSIPVHCLSGLLFPGMMVQRIVVAEVGAPSYLRLHASLRSLTESSGFTLVTLNPGCFIMWFTLLLYMFRFFFSCLLVLQKNVNTCPLLVVEIGLMEGMCSLYRYFRHR